MTSDDVIDALARDAKRETMRARLVAVAGNVSELARREAAGEPVTNVRRRLDRRITALGLRSWLAETYPATSRAKPNAQ